MTSRRFLVVANANAGSTESEAVTKAANVLRRSGEVEVVATGAPDEVDGPLDRLDDRTLVVAGGDGSVHAVVEALRRRGELAERPLGLVPLGTGNDLARALGLPLDPEGAAAVLLASQPRRLDLIVADDDTVVVNAAHAGLGSEAAAAGAALKSTLKKLAYPIGAVMAALREKGWPLSIEVDGRPLVRDQGVLLAGVGNGTSIGGGTPLFPGARLDDGLLDVVVATATGPIARVAYGLALRKGEHLGRNDVVRATGRAVRISGAPVRHNRDGEITDETTERTYRIEPRAWSVLTAEPR